MKSNKQFDCLEMKAEIQKIILEETANMDTKALLQYFNAGLSDYTKATRNLYGDMSVAALYTKIKDYENTNA